ncbi:MAG: DUF58 domain-containing protein [Bacteroidota bacterium]
MLRTFWSRFFIAPRLYLALAVLAAVFVAGYFVPALVVIGRVLAWGLVALVVVDGALLFRIRDGLAASRAVPQRLSNGDDNPIRLTVTNHHAFPARIEVVDELPIQFQVRDALFAKRLAPGEASAWQYTVRPTRRGSYDFGALLAFAASPIGLLQRRYAFHAEGTAVPVYPSYLQMRQYELLAISNRLTEVGIKPQRRAGRTMEFDHIRDYVIGDDYRTVNWKATARRGQLRVNQYREERGQSVYALLDMGRVMKMPFEGLTLLDYSINAALVLSNIAIMKHDRAGLITFSHEMGPMVPASKRNQQMRVIQETLYNLDTQFLESDYEALYAQVRRQVRQRSLLLLFTNFTTRSGLERQLPYLQALGRQHVVVAIFFQNTELDTLLHTPTDTTESVYIRAMAEHFTREQTELVAILRQHGIQSILTPPSQLTANTINRYLEIKARGTL